MRKAFILAALLENYISEEVHVSFHITNEGMRYFLNPPQKKLFKGIYASIENSGKEAGTELYCPIEL